MTAEMDVFLEQQERITCTRMQAVISRAACMEYKRGERYKFYCETCNGGVEMAGSCKCGGTIVAKGMCRKCYDADRQQSKAQNKPVPHEVMPGPSAAAEEGAVPPPSSSLKPSPIDALLGAPSSLIMTLDFSQDQDIYRHIVDHGITADDILGLLSMLFDNQLRRVA